MMSAAIFFLIAAVALGAGFVVLEAALANHPMPSQSGYLPVALFCLVAAPFSLFVAVCLWIVAVSL